jgi:hypothetical protein
LGRKVGGDKKTGKCRKNTKYEFENGANIARIGR